MIKTTAILATLTIATGVLAQGNLAPPGAPAPTMKTLDQVESRVPVSSAGTVISQSGSYYLTTNITATSGQNGITVEADAVTIDLNGFSLNGSGSDSGYGIYQSSIYRNLAVRNGVVAHWRGFQKGGVYAEGNAAVFRDLQVLTNYAGVQTESNVSISGCVADGNTRYGFYAREGASISECVSRNNGTYGIYVYSGGSISKCSVESNGSSGIGTFNGATISGCTAKSNGGSGILAAYNGIIGNCSVQDNESDGIYTQYSATISDCSLKTNDGNGIYTLSGASITGCSVMNNFGVGIYAVSGTSISKCSVQYNSGDGIWIDNGNLVADCLCDQNGYASGDGAGIHAIGSHNRIDNNNITRNDRGIQVDGTDRTIVIRNVLSGNTTAFDIPHAGNFVGTIQTSMPTIGGPWDNFSL